jgi:hypothetical protein
MGERSSVTGAWEGPRPSTHAPGLLPDVATSEGGTGDSTARAFPTPLARLTRVTTQVRLGYVVRNGRYWARTSDPQLVELVLSQLS